MREDGAGAAGRALAVWPATIVQPTAGSPLLVGLIGNAPAHAYLHMHACTWMCGPQPAPHLGPYCTCSYYAEKVAAEGLIGIVFAQSPEFVAPHGAKQAIFGTNPIAFAAPAAGGPVVMDLATAAYAWFGLLEAQTAGRAIPGDVALDAQGQPTTNPSDVLSGGAIRVFDRWV